MTAVSFPEGFLWGTATAAYQIEGAVTEDGRGQSIWDVFSATPGKIRDGDTGAVACDHYHRWPEDVALMAGLGYQAYRFSIVWPRIIPDGDGPVNRAGIDHYSRLVDALLEHGITPMATLYHWDLPQPLQERGGWTVRGTVDAFARYAEIVASALGDRVPMWVTVNEPAVVAGHGHGSGVHAPGISDGRAALEAAHHLLLGHARAAEALRTTTGQVGIALSVTDVVAGREGAEHAAAAARVDGHNNRWYLDPLLRGHYPADLVDWFGATFHGIVREGDLDLIARPMDFLGLNYYFRSHIVAGAAPDTPPAEPPLHAHRVVPSELPVTAMGWPVEPDGFRAFLSRVARDYPDAPPIYITENGAAHDDMPDQGGDVDDPARIAYLDGHLRAMREAMAAGADIRGYFCWSLLDNFEWAEGYAKRFGLVHVDYATQRRTPKSSARWYAEVVKQNGLQDPG